MNNSKISAVIFDFNGTLFNDTDFHNRAWMEFTKRHAKDLRPEDLDKHVHGFTNKEILEYLFGRKVLGEELTRLYEEKESIYRKLCENYPKECILTPGAESFFNKLSEKKIPSTIATASYKVNVEMYFQMFHLSRWFDPNKIVYDTGKHRGKPFPDMFLEASSILNIPPGECMIIEDSPGGLQAAKNAGAGKIIAVNFNKQQKRFLELEFIDQTISHFDEILL